MEFMYTDVEDEQETGSYTFDLLIPYGELKTAEVNLEYVPKPKKEGADRDDPQPLEQNE